MASDFLAIWGDDSPDDIYSSPSPRSDETRAVSAKLAPAEEVTPQVDPSEMMQLLLLEIADARQDRARFTALLAVGGALWIMIMHAYVQKVDNSLRVLREEMWFHHGS